MLELLSNSCRLRCSHTGISRIPIKPSAAGWGSAIGTVIDSTEQKRLDYPEDNDALPPLEELFGELQGDEYIERLEELAESLLREVTAEVEASTCRSNEQITIKQDTTEESDDTEGMVGQTPENVETRTTVQGIRSNDNYRCNSIVQPEKTLTTSLPVNSTRNFEFTSTTTSQHRINEKLENSNIIAPEIFDNEKLSLKREIRVKEEPPANDMDTVYGTYDEATNCITIIYPDDTVGIQECVQEVSSTNSENSIFDDITNCEKTKNLQTPVNSQDMKNNYNLSPAYTLTDSLSSPLSINSEDSDSAIANYYTIESGSISDCGYESHDSPQQSNIREKSSLVSTNGNTVNACSLTDLWHESFSELFPSLA